MSAASFLFVPMTPDGPRLTQPTTYSPHSCSPAVAGHAPALVADQPALVVERDAAERHAAVADRAEHEPAGDDLLLARGDGAAVLDPVLDDADAGHRAVLAVAEDLDRRAQEAQLDAPVVAVRLALRVVAQDLDVALVGRLALALQPVGALGVELHLGRVDDDVGARELAELAQLRVRERGLRGAAAAEHDHVLDLGGGERADGVVGGVGDRDLVGVEHEHPGDVDGDVAVADHDRARGGQIELVVGVVGVAVVPGHELGRRVRARPVLARDPEPVVDRRADA